MVLKFEYGSQKAYVGRTVLWNMTFDETKKAAEQGDAQAQFELGEVCFKQRNYYKSAQWFQKAARQNNIPALCSLGWMYFKGRGVQKNFETAKWCYRKAAEQGDPHAQYNLGMMYIHERQSSKEAFTWLEKAAINGHAEAQYQVGRMYASGDGVSRDMEKSKFWYEAADEQGHLKAQDELDKIKEQNKMSHVAQMDKNGSRDDEKLSTSEKIKELYEAAKQGDAEAQNELGLVYEHGNGVKKNYRNAELLFQRAAKQGHADAQYNWGRMCEPRDKDEAMRWYQKAAEQGHYEAQKKWLD